MARFKMNSRVRCIMCEIQITWISYQKDRLPCSLVHSQFCEWEIHNLLWYFVSYFNVRVQPSTSSLRVIPSTHSDKQHSSSPSQRSRNTHHLLLPLHAHRRRSSRTQRRGPSPARTRTRPRTRRTRTRTLTRTCTCTRRTCCVRARTRTRRTSNRARDSNNTRLGTQNNGAQLRRHRGTKLIRDGRHGRQCSSGGRAGADDIGKRLLAAGQERLGGDADSKGLCLRPCGW